MNPGNRCGEASCRGLEEAAEVLNGAETNRYSSSNQSPIDTQAGRRDH